MDVHSWLSSHLQFSYAQGLQCKPLPPPPPRLSASISVKATGGGGGMKHEPSLGDGLAQYLYIYTAPSSPSHLVRFQSVFPTSPKYGYYAEKYACVYRLTVQLAPVCLFLFFFSEY
jgi:hypothetical protein